MSEAWRVRRQHGGRGVRVGLGQRQHRPHDPYLPAVAVALVEGGDGLLDALGLTEPHQGLQLLDLQRRKG